jgi:hypothetical protein
VSKKANLFGGSGEVDRGKWRTPKKWAGYVGPWDLDPFSNPDSHIEALVHCMLERGDDAFGGRTLGERLVGEYLVTSTHGKPLGPGELARLKNGKLASRVGRRIAGEHTRVWIQPPYELVDQALDHFGHTRFCALLRFDTRTKWFDRLYRLIHERRGLIACTRGSFNFEPAPGMPKPSSNIFPHALFYADARDVTDAVLRRCFAWRP